MSSIANHRETCSSALVPYVKPMMLAGFTNDQRTVTIGKQQFVFRQNWLQNGIAGVIWDSSIVLARYIAQNAEIVANRSVLELGAGLGLPSIVATYQNPSYIHITDQETAIPLLQENVQRNANSECHIKIFKFDWNIDKIPQKYQVILGADLIYIGAMLEALIKVLNDAVDTNTVIYLCSRIRYQKDRDFYEQLRHEHFDVQQISFDSIYDSYIYKIRKLTN